MIVYFRVSNDINNKVNELSKITSLQLNKIYTNALEYCIGKKYNLQPQKYNKHDEERINKKCKIKGILEANFEAYIKSNNFSKKGIVIENALIEYFKELELQ